MARRIALAAFAAFALATQAAAAAMAPGRVAVSVASSAPHFDVSDGYDVYGSAALPDGGVVILHYDTPTRTALALRLRRDGARDPAFGTDGIARIAAPGAGFRAHHVLRLTDGRLLVAGSRPAGSLSQPLRLVIVRLLPSGAPDPSFGAGGVVATSLVALVSGSPVALAPDGSIVLTGGLPRTADAGSTTPTDWVVAKLGADGAPDEAFGVVKIPVGGDQGSTGLGVAVTPTGSVVTLGAAPLNLTSNALHLMGLTALGAPDPGFNGGAPAPVPLAGAFGLQRHASGALDVLAGDAIVRFGASGVLDTTYGSGGRFALDPRGGPITPLALPDASTLLVSRTPDHATGTLDERLTVQRVTAAGADGGSTRLLTPFGGGFATGKRTAGSVAQNSFRGSLLRRDDGSFVAVGLASVYTPSGKQDGTVAEFVAAAAFTPRLAPDRSFGGPQRPATIDVGVRRQRAVSSSRSRAILLRVRAPEAGVMRLRVRDARGGRLLGGTLAPVYAAGVSTVRANLTSHGVRRLARAHRGLRITVRHEFRDIVAGTDTGVTRGRLR